MSHVAESYVYQSLDEGRPGYVGRAPRGNFVLVARRGAVLDDEVVEELGLSDLKDHTDYEKVLATAKENGAPVTVRKEDGSIMAEVQENE